MVMNYPVYYPVSSPNLREKVQIVGDWLKSEIGKENEDWLYLWGPDTFYFKHEEDKVKFILKWL